MNSPIPDFDIDSLLANILDDSKPLPTAPETITPPEPEIRAGTGDALDDAAWEKVYASDDEPPEVNRRLTDTPVTAEPAEEAIQVTEIPYDLPPPEFPTFTTEEIAKTLDLRNFATLVTLNCKRWHAKVKDKKASKDVADANDADAAAFDTYKHVLSGADAELKAVNRAIDKARAKFYERTLPWAVTGITDEGRRRGARIMPNTDFFEFISEMGACKQEMLAALDAFEAKFPDAIEKAKMKLGRRFNPADYPPVASIRSMFDLNFDFAPIPQGGDFSGLPDQQCQALADALVSKQAKMVENAMQDLWTRAYEAVGRMAERLSHPDKEFHSSLVENVRSVARQLRHLNVTKDPRIDHLRDDIEAHLCNLTAKDLREHPIQRMTAAGHAASVLEKMAKFAKGE